MTNEKQTILYLEMYLYKAKKLIVKRNCSLDDLEVAETYLNKCKALIVHDDMDIRIDLWFGKLEVRRSRVVKDESHKKLSLGNAKASFLSALNRKTNRSSYYGLYKIAVFEEDFEQAKENLENFQQYYKKNYYNFTLVHQLLDICRGVESTYLPIKSEYIFTERIKYLPLEENYRLAEESLNNKLYHRCLKHLLICQKLAMINSITIDFSTVIVLVNKVITLKNVSHLDEVKANLLKTTHSGEKIVLVTRLLKENPNAVDLYFLLLDSYIEVGVYNFIPEILSKIMMLELDDLSLKRVKYYEGLFREQVSYAENMALISGHIQEGDEFIRAGSMQQAYNAFVNGLQKTNHSIFSNKLGDLFYYDCNYIRAEQYYVDYLMNGYSEQFDVYVKLYIVYRKLNDLERVVAITKEAFTKLFLADKGYTVETWRGYLENEYNQELLSKGQRKKVKTLTSN